MADEKLSTVLTREELEKRLKEITEREEEEIFKKEEEYKANKIRDEKLIADKIEEDRLLREQIKKQLEVKKEVREQKHLTCSDCGSKEIISHKGEFTFSKKELTPSKYEYFHQAIILKQKGGTPVAITLAKHGLSIKDFDYTE